MGLFDGDNKIYSFAYFFLTATYLIPIGLAIRYKLQTTNTATFWGKTFVVFLLIGCLVRQSNWICQPFIHANMLVVNNFENFYWGIAPSYFFSSSYMVILFMWMEIYHGESGESLHLQFVYIYINIIMYLANIGLAVGDYICNPSIIVKNSLPFTFLQKVTNTEAGVVYLLTSICFFIYGGRFYLRFSPWGENIGTGPLLFKMKHNILPRVKILTIMGSTIFMSRGVTVIVSAVHAWKSEWYIDLPYYIFGEVIPLVLLLLVLHPTQNRQPEQLPIKINYEAFDRAHSANNNILVYNK